MTRLKVATRDTFRSLQHRNFRIFFVAQGISFVGTWIQLASQTLLVYRLTGSGTALGVLTAIQFLPTLVLGAWAGVVVDRYDKRRIITIASTVTANMKPTRLPMMIIAHPCGVVNTSRRNTPKDPGKIVHARGWVGPNVAA